MNNRIVFSSLITRRRGKMACSPAFRNGPFTAGREKLEKKTDQSDAGNSTAAETDNPEH